MCSQKMLIREECILCRNLNILIMWKIWNKINYSLKTMPKKNSFSSKNSSLKTYYWEVGEKYKAIYYRIWLWWAYQESALTWKNSAVSDRVMKNSVPVWKHLRLMMNLVRTISIESSKSRIIRGRSKERKSVLKRWSKLELTLWWRSIMYKTVLSQTKIH